MTIHVLIHSAAQLQECLINLFSYVCFSGYSSCRTKVQNTPISPKCTDTYWLCI